MLRELHISGLGVIDDLDLALHPGLNVLTGETGAGKTMITVGLALALGAAASASLVRDGASAARVQARFDVGSARRPPPMSSSWVEDGEVLLARSVPAEGKGSARIGGQLATASALAALGARARRGARPAPGQRLLDQAHADRVPRPVRRRRAPRRPGRVPRGVRCAARGHRRSSSVCARRPATVSASSTCSPTRCARSRPCCPSRASPGASAAEEARLGHVERLLEWRAAAEAGARRRRRRRGRCPRRGRAGARRHRRARPRGRPSSRSAERALAAEVARARA